MTIPKFSKLTDMVRQMIPHSRFALSPEEQRLGLLLRGNKELLEALKGVIDARIAARANVPEPSEPLVAKSMIARDRELQGLRAKLEFIYNSPINPPAIGDREQPA